MLAGASVARSQETPGAPGETVRVVLEGGVPIPGATVVIRRVGDNVICRLGYTPRMSRTLAADSARVLPDWTDARARDMDSLTIDGGGLPYVLVATSEASAVIWDSHKLPQRPPWRSARDISFAAALSIDPTTTPATWTVRWRGGRTATPVVCRRADGSVVTRIGVVDLATWDRHGSDPDGHLFLLRDPERAKGFLLTPEGCAPVYVADESLRAPHEAAKLLEVAVRPRRTLRVRGVLPEAFPKGRYWMNAFAWDATHGALLAHAAGESSFELGPVGDGPIDVALSLRGPDWKWFQGTWTGTAQGEEIVIELRPSRWTYAADGGCHVSRAVSPSRDVWTVAPPGEEPSRHGRIGDTFERDSRFVPVIPGSYVVRSTRPDGTEVEQFQVQARDCATVEIGDAPARSPAQPK